MRAINSIAICILFSALVCIASSCHKGSSEITGGIPSSEKGAGARAAMIKGTWIWDSTSFLSNDSLKYSYTGKGFFSYLNDTTIKICRAISNYTLSFENLPMYLDASGLVNEATSGSGSGFVGELQNSSLDNGGSAALLDFKGASESGDTLLSVDDKWLWLMYSKNEGSEVYISVRGNESVEHTCSIILGRLIFPTGNYKVDEVSEKRLKLSSDETPRNGIRKSAYYFHR